MAISKLHRPLFIGAPWILLSLVLKLCACDVAVTTAQSILPVRFTTLEFTSSQGDTLFELPALWLLTDSLRAERRGQVLEPLRDYRIVTPGSKLWLFAPLAPGDTLRVYAAYLPVPLLRSYARRSLRDLERFVPVRDTTVASSAFGTAGEESSWSALRRSGSLIRSVQIGTNQDLAFESALSLQVEGRVGSNVDVVAALSDQDLPIQPEGTTESIRELDKVYVTARSPNLEATIGDYELSWPGRRYDSYFRKLSGLQAGARTHGVAAVVSAAVSRGEFHTNRFAGEESVQGPYQLSGKNGETGIVVLAGTERVWLDGLELRRGIENDYTADYAAGQLTFTSRRLITSDSRIVVEFEYANEDFERQYLGARTSLTGPRMPVNAYVTYISESDDRTRPLGLSFDDAERAQLIAAGDSSIGAFGNSADSLGANRGDYVRRDTLYAGTVYSIFVYVAPDTTGIPQGEWQVFFDDFGAGQGDYEATADALGRTSFTWIAPNGGRYRPARRLPQPTRADLFAVRIERDTAIGFRALAEASLTNSDLNTYSTRDDADNDGGAASVELGYNRPELGIGGYRLRQISASVAARTRGRTYRDVSRSDEVEFDRDWAASVVRQATERVGEANLALAPIRNWTLRGGAGLLNREEILDSRRFNLGSSFAPGKLFAIKVEHTAIVTDDSTADLHTDWIRQHADGSARWRMLSPRLNVNRERRLTDSRYALTGFRFVEWNAGNLWQLTNQLSLDGEYGARQDDARTAAASFRKASAAKTYAGELRWQPLDIGRGSLRWTHREKSFESSDSVAASSDAGRLELLLAPRSRLYEVNLLYDALKSRTEQQLQVFVPVSPGTGDYRLENGVYLPDDQGDFILVSRNTGGFEPSSELRANAVLWFRPDETRRAGDELWRKFAFETEASVEERTRSALSLSLLLLDRAKLRTPETIDGRFSVRQDVHFNRLSRQFSVRLRGVNSAAQVSRFTNGSQQSVRHEGALRVRYRYVEPLRAEVEMSSELDRTLFEGVSIASTDVRRDHISHDLLWTITERWETGLALSGVESRDERSRTQASVREAAPRIGYTRFRQGRVDAEFRWLRVSSNRARLPQELASGGNRGDNFRWSMRATLAFSANFSGSVNYTGRLDSGEATQHIGRVEVRATF